MLPRLRVKAWSKGKSVFARDERGQTLVEFALVLPLLLMLLTGIIVFGIIFWDQITLTEATTAAAQAASISRASGPVDVCNPVNTALTQSAPILNNPAIYGAYPLSYQIETITTGATPTTTIVQAPTHATFCAVAGSNCAAACMVTLAQGEQINVSTTYGCQVNFFGSTLTPNCELTAKTAEVVQ